jgi:hypothetical protein
MQQTPVGPDVVVADPTEKLLALLAHKGLHLEEVADLPTGRIVNVSDGSGVYLYTLTISRTPGY